ncbi:MAG: hypothetical protein AAFO59_09395 [Cyanobacteria bacterium J06607_17]
MAGIANRFLRANDRFRQRDYQRWHQGRRKRQILRSQIGFSELVASRPPACVGCDNYHGHAYGLQRSQRVPLICAIHPYGWQKDTPCPDWRAIAIEF